MKTLIVGLGVQGHKRLAVAGDDVVATVDPVAHGASYGSLDEVPLDSFDAALVCTPDQTKLELVRALLSHGKHVLVEKPLLASNTDHLRQLGELARSHRAACYTAYNHRFEPQLVRLKALLDAGALGTVYVARLVYGNGTARNVKGSWRDQGLGVLSDLGSHLLDLVQWLFGRPQERFELWSFSRFENHALDHVRLGTQGRPSVELEASLVSWRNTFTIDVVGELGSAHVEGLCKWGPSTLMLRTRVLPSGKPHEDVQALEGPDPTWALEYQHFNALCRSGGTTLDHDLWINDVLNDLAHSVVEAVAA